MLLVSGVGSGKEGREEASWREALDGEESWTGTGTQGAKKGKVGPVVNCRPKCNRKDKGGTWEQRKKNSIQG